MFRKLRLQFILTNLTIITVLFIALTIGVYTLLQIKMLDHAELFMKDFAAGINSGMFPDTPIKPPERMEAFPGGHPPGVPFKPPHHAGISTMLDHPLGPPDRDRNEHFPVVFFVKINNQGVIIDRSHHESLPAKALSILISQAKTVRENHGLIKVSHSRYYFYRTPLKKQQGTLLIFQDLQRDRKIQQTLVILLILIGLVFVIFSMVGSFLVAKRAITPIQKAWQQQKDFLADASHELRTPLTIIQTNLEVILSNPSETVASQMEWLSNIRDELQQTTSLVSSLLFLARVDARQYSMNKSEFLLDQTLERVSESFRACALAKNICLATDHGGQMLYYGDEANIKQVVSILLDNALRHTPEGGKISLELHKTEKHIMLNVMDNGEGIPSEYLEKIFDRFYQVDSSRSRGKAGLGLSIAKSIVENHGGTIQVTSTLGKGSLFTVVLPLVKHSSARESVHTTINT